MDFRAEIDRAEREVESARTDHARAMKRLEQALKKLGALTGVYRGLSAFDDDHALAMPDQPTDSSDTAYRHQTRQRAPWGEGRRRAAAMLTEAWPDGLTKEQIHERAAAQGKPLPTGTLRRALRQLHESGRARVKDDLWFAVRDDGVTDKEAAGADQSHPAASFTRGQEDNHEAAITEPVA